MGPDIPVNESRLRSPYSSRNADPVPPSEPDTEGRVERRSEREAVSVSAVAAFFEAGSSTTSKAAPSTAPKSRSDNNIVERTGRFRNRRSDHSSRPYGERPYSSTRDVSVRGESEEDPRVRQEPEEDGFVGEEEWLSKEEGVGVGVATPKHNCVESLRKLVQIQQEQIGNLEFELSKFASFFGEREDALLARISALHGEIVVFRDLVRDNYRDSRSTDQDMAADASERMVEARLRKCQNGKLGFSIVPASRRECFGGVFLHRASPSPSPSPFATDAFDNGDWILEVGAGADASEARHREAVEAFGTAKEAVVVRVPRRESSRRDADWTNSTAEGEDADRKEGNANWTTWPTLRDTCTQTEWSGGWAESTLVSFTRDGSVFSPEASPSRSACLSRPDSPHQPQPEDEDAGCEVEYEEVRLRRSWSAEKLGLTLCYGAPDDSDTDIYVSEVEPFSVAGKDGRILEGDQLLRINGVEVRNREQAVSLFSEKRSDVTLLVTRPRQDAAPDDDDEDSSDRERPHDALIEEDELEDELEEGLAQHEKDSGVGRTDESTKNEESSEENLEQLEAALDAASSVPPNLSVSGNESLGGRLASKCASTSTSNLDLSAVQTECIASIPNPLGRYQSDASLDREMASLNREMEHIQLECESLVHRHASSEWRNKKSGSPSSSCHTRLSGGGDSVAGDQLYVNLVDLQNQLRTGRFPEAPRAERGRPVSAEDVSLTGRPVSAEDVSRSPSSLFRARSRAVSKKEAVEKWVKSVVFGRARREPLSSPRRHPGHDRDSAYNTGGSTPLTLELSPSLPGLGLPADKRNVVAASRRASVVSLVSPGMEDKGTQLRESDVASIFSCDSCRRCCRALAQSERFYRESVGRRLSPDLSRGSLRLSNGGGRQRAASDQGSSRGSLAKDDIRYSEKNENYVTFHPRATMYTNRANLQRTIWLQQRLFRDSLRARETTDGEIPIITPALIACQAPEVVPPPSNSRPSSPSKPNTPLQERVKMEWKVKKRADGTRYIARRPARNKILKERALKINEERLGLTTDDDAVSELKVGRYWNKEERKRHLERARDRKSKELRQRAGPIPAQDRPVTALELSREKMFEKKSRAVFDDFTTVREVLAHGNKTRGSKNLGLLSVTTV